MKEENEIQFQNILKALTQELGSEELRREEDGRVIFTLDDRVGVALFTVDAEEGEVDSLVAILPLGPVPDNNTALLHRLLCANYLGADTADGTIAIDEEIGCFVLTRVFEMPLSEEAFLPALGRLVNAARYWIDTIEKDLSSATEDDAAQIRV